MVLANDKDVSRFAFVCSRRVGNAVTRNRIKRLMREVVHLHLSIIEPGWDCVFLARPAIAAASYSEVETAVLELLGRAGLLPEKLDSRSVMT